MQAAESEQSIGSDFIAEENLHFEFSWTPTH